MSAVPTVYSVLAGTPLLEGYGLTEATCASARGFVDVRRPVRSGSGCRTHTSGSGRGCRRGDRCRSDQRADRLPRLRRRPGRRRLPAPHRPGQVPVAYVTLADGTVGEAELRAWAAAQVGEAAAAPKAVHVLDALPVTAVGKPYKVPLRADATRHALAAALGGIAEVEEVRADVDNGQVTVTVTVAAGASARAEAERVVAEFALQQAELVWVSRPSRQGRVL
ncbi:AMP-binding enzyme [Streptomyces sp. CA-249302]|uniref:AMP-binding enzyme n=1 Tax=Streptomyces sp. CA-249302 TaxID=3240058 RepID=UPI003D8D18F3